MPHLSADSEILSWAGFFVPTNSSMPPSLMSSLISSVASPSRSMVCWMSIIWMPLRPVKMNERILGCQRFTRCPKWAPASSNSFISTTAMVRLLLLFSTSALFLPDGNPGYAFTPHSRALPARSEGVLSPDNHYIISHRTPTGKVKVCLGESTLAEHQAHRTPNARSWATSSCSPSPPPEARVHRLSTTRQDRWLEEERPVAGTPQLLAAPPVTAPHQPDSG